MSAPAVFDAVILAGGASTRLGQPKQLVTLWQRTLLERAAALARQAGARVTHVVLGAGAATCCEALAQCDVVVHVHHGWARGQATTLAHGLRAAAGAQGILTLVCDQYRLTLDDVVPLVQRWRASPRRVVAARYSSATGVPVIWPAEQARNLAASGQSGKSWLATCQPLLIDTPNAAYDLDTTADLAALRQFEARHAPG